jgi:hypothetical protein
MKGVAYGVWLKSSDLKSRAQLAVTLQKQYDSTVQVAKDGSGLDVIFIDRDEDAHRSNGRAEVGRDSSDTEKSWSQLAQKAVFVLVSNEAIV